MKFKASLVTAMKSSIFNLYNTCFKAIKKVMKVDMISNNSWRQKRITQAIIEYLAHGFFLTLAYFIYSFYPLWFGFLEGAPLQFLLAITVVYWLLGLAYFILRNIFFAKLYLNQPSKALLIIDYLINLAKAAVWFLGGKRPPLSRKSLVFDETLRVATTSFLIRFFFLPLMVAFLFSNLKSTEIFLSYFNQAALPTDWKWWYRFIFINIFTIDVIIYGIGYLFEAKWLRNEIKSTDPYLSGWVVTLICYQPFYTIVNNIIPLTYKPINPFFDQPWLNAFFHLGTLAGFLLYLSATLALFTKASNLVNRGIVFWGPYRFIRHPGYVGKNFAWWMMNLPSMVTPLDALPLLIWNGIYFLRAVTEERHLKKDPVYRSYQKNHPWRFIPKLT